MGEVKKEGKWGGDRLHCVKGRLQRLNFPL